MDLGLGLMGLRSLGSMGLRKKLGLMKKTMGWSMQIWANQAMGPKYGVGYTEAFVIVAELNTVRLLSLITMEHGM